MSENIPISFRLLQGLNTNAGLLRTEDRESTDLVNVDFNRLGSILKRKGYHQLNETSIHISGASPYVPGTDNPPPITGDTGDWGIPLFDLGYGFYFLGGFESSGFIAPIGLTHTESKA